VIYSNILYADRETNIEHVYGLIIKKVIKLSWDLYLIVTLQNTDYQDLNNFL